MAGPDGWSVRRLELFSDHSTGFSGAGLPDRRGQDRDGLAPRRDRSRSKHILWLLEGLGLRYRRETFLRRPDLYGPEEMKRVHALGRAPVIVDGDVVLAESGAIVRYVLARHGGGRRGVIPAAPNFARYLYGLRYAEGSLILQLMREMSVDRMLPDADAHPGMARLRDGTRQHLGMVDEALRASPHPAGPDFTAADIMMAYPFTTLRREIRSLDLAPCPAIEAWVRRLEARPAFRKATAPA